MIGDLATVAGADLRPTPMPVPLAEMHDVAQRLIQASVSAWLPEEGYLSLVDRAALRRPMTEPAGALGAQYHAGVRAFKMAEQQRDPQ